MADKTNNTKKIQQNPSRCINSFELPTSGWRIVAEAVTTEVSEVFENISLYA